MHCETSRQPLKTYRTYVSFIKPKEAGVAFWCFQKYWWWKFMKALWSFVPDTSLQSVIPTGCDWSHPKMTSPKNKAKKKPPKDSITLLPCFYFVEVSVNRLMNHLLLYINAWSTWLTRFTESITGWISRSAVWSHTSSELLCSLHLDASDLYWKQTVMFFTGKYCGVIAFFLSLVCV